MWEALAIVVLSGLATEGVRRGMRGSRRMFMPAAVATVWGAAALIATYLWVFEAGACSSDSDIACRLNANQGVLTLYGLVLAVVAVWITLVVRHLEDASESRASETAYASAIRELVLETSHNLIHVARAFDADKKLRHLPQISRVAVSRVLEPEFAVRLGRPLRNAVDALYRNGELLSHQDCDTSLSDQPPTTLRNFTMSSLQVLLDAVRKEPQALTDWLEGAYARDFVRLKGTHVHVHFYASAARRSAAHLRAVEGAVLCWWKDADVEGVHVVEEGQRYIDLYASG